MPHQASKTAIYFPIVGQNTPNTLVINGINFAYMEWILAKIKAVRRAKGISQEEMADKIGIDQKTYNNWETGRTDLTTRNIVRIAKALDVDPQVIWDPEQFNNPNWKQPEFDGKILSLKEPDFKYQVKEGKKYVLLDDCLTINEKLQEEILLLKAQNRALSLSLNTLFDSKDLKKGQ